MRRLLLMCLAMLFGVLNASAQDRTISGRVTDQATGEGLPGVTVLVKSTTIGTSTNSDGNFTLQVPPSVSVLEFRYIGYATITQTLGSESTVEIKMATDTKQLGEVVVTALGREEQRKTLGYAIQDVSGASLTQAREPNVVNSLQGRIAGVQISNSQGAVGSSSRIVIRGVKSITGNNQPLFVVDGQPIDNSNFANSGPNGGIDYGNAVSDISPDDIENISILKGPNAAALYGTRGLNGVVVITTKSGRKSRGLGITVNSTTTFETPLKLPDYQNSYGQGSGGEFEFVDGAGGGTNDGTDESWGPRLDGRLLPQFNSPVVNGVRQPTPWVAHPDNVKDFFQVGRTLTNNVAISGGNDKAGVRLSFTNLDQKGILPNTYLRRNTINLNGGADLSSKLKFSTNVNYSQTLGRRPQLGYSSQNVMQQFIWFGRQVDISQLKDFEKPNEFSATRYNWNNNYHNNPYYTLNRNTNDDKRDRIIGNVTLSYRPTDWLTLVARTTNDFYFQFNQRRIGIDDIEQSINDDYTEEKIDVTERNNEILATVVKGFGEDFTVDANFGANRRNSEQRISMVAAPDLAVPGLYSLSNSSLPLLPNATTNNNTAYLNPITRRRINSVYGSARFGFRDYLFVGVTGRNDWSSVLASGNRSFFYPSVDASLVVSQLLDMPNDGVLSFAKVRAGYAEVGNDTDPYRLRDIFTIGQPFGGSPTLSVGNTLANSNLKAERNKSLEAGVEVRFLNNRIGLELTGYSSRTVNQILLLPVTSATGYLQALLNSGELSNKGIEAVLNVAPLPTESAFQWNLTANFAANRNRVESLDKAGDLKTYVLGTTWGLNVESRVGEQYGALFGNGYQRSPDGKVIYDEDGLPLTDPTRKVLGHYTPNWIGGLNNAFSYKGIVFSFLIDTRQGGELYSVTNTWGNYAGTLETSLPGRDGGVIGDGVIKNADGTFRPNDVKADAETFYKETYVNSLHEPSVYDASFVKLREVKLGYQLPATMLSKTPFKTVGISFVARNLWLIDSKVPNVDPETSYNNGNVQGLEFGQIPSTRSYGFNVNFGL